MGKGTRDSNHSKKTTFQHLVGWASYVLNTPTIIIFLEIRKLESWGKAFLKTTKLISGKTGI